VPVEPLENPTRTAISRPRRTNIGPELWQ
jgi:hypothetical protein